MKIDDSPNRSVLEAYRLDRIFLNVTDACNLRCGYCYANSGVERTENLPLDTIRSLADDAALAGATSILLSGGEPFMRADFVEIVNVFTSRGFQVSISSNGACIDEETARTLGEYEKLLFQISLDGNRDSVDSLTGVPNSFDRIVAGIDRLCHVGFPIQLNSVLQASNYGDIPYLLEFAAKRELVLRFTLLSSEYGRAAGKPSCLSIIQLEKAIRAIHLARKAYPLVELNIPPLLLHPDDWFPITPACGWARHMCGVLSDGSVTVCGLAIDQKDLIAGNIRDSSLSEIWHSAQLFNELRQYSLDDIAGICSECPFLYACGGSCRLSPYVAGSGFCGSNALCEAYSEALDARILSADDFPSRVVSLGLMKPSGQRTSDVSSL